MHDDDELTQERDRLSGLFGIADEIIDAGFDCFPAAVWVKDDGSVAKAPLMRNGHLGAHRDRQLIRQQIINPPHVPLGVPEEHEVVVAFIPGSGGCGVLDCDVKHGKSGKEALRALTGLYGDFYKAAWRSPSGGVNILFDKPPATAYGNASPWTGIDVRADNGWVVAPGNVCAAGSWEWKLGGFTTAAQLPDAMAGMLTQAATHGRKASNAETIAFIEASPESSSLPAMHAFDQELKRFRSAASGSRHDALMRVVSWACGMNALDLRWAIERIKDEWLALTAGEGREDEVTDVLTWVVGQEIPKRSAPTSSGSPAEGEAGIDRHLSSFRVEPADVFIDWEKFAQRDATTQQWTVEGFWPLGRAIALWADAKEGKSELALWAVANLALGRHPWNGTAVDPVDIVYLDFEMTEDDLEERLSDFGIDDVTKLGHLHYALMPTLAPLDSEKGGEELCSLVASVNASAVVIDTFGRSIEGEEDKADTVNAFYRHTGMRLKAEGIGYLRTDHAGKDRSRGQRGSSAKRGDVDVIWQQSRTTNGAMLDCTGSSRLSWVGPKLALDRVVDPQHGTIGWSTPVSFNSVPAGTNTKMAELDKAGVPLDAGRPKAVELLRAAGIKPGRLEVLGAALKARRERAQRLTNSSQTVPGTALGNNEPGTAENSSGDAIGDLFSDQGECDGNT